MNCEQCGDKIVNKSKHTTGYGTNDSGQKICYACCGLNDLEYMRKNGRIALYLTIEENGKGTVTNWPASIKWKKIHVRKGSHNIAGVRYDVWFHFEGYEWHGVCYGDNTQILHCKRTKTRAKSITMYNGNLNQWRSKCTIQSVKLV